MGTGNNAAHHFELLRSRDSSDPFNSRRGESRRNGLESPPELPATIPWASLGNQEKVNKKSRGIT